MPLPLQIYECYKYLKRNSTKDHCGFRTNGTPKSRKTEKEVFKFLKSYKNLSQIKRFSIKQRPWLPMDSWGVKQVNNKNYHYIYEIKEANWTVDELNNRSNGLWIPNRNIYHMATMIQTCKLTNGYIIYVVPDGSKRAIYQLSMSKYLDNIPCTNIKTNCGHTVVVHGDHWDRLGII